MYLNSIASLMSRMCCDEGSVPTAGGAVFVSASGENDAIEYSQTENKEYIVEAHNARLFCPV